MKRFTYALIAAIVLTASRANGQTAAQSPAPGPLGIGFQATFPVWGLSILYNTPSGLGFQGILGAMGDLKEYGGRLLYRIPTASQPRPYLYGSTGLWSYTGTSVDDNYNVKSTTETVPGFGAGAGVEYGFSSMPNLAFNLEIGIGSVHFKDVSYNYSSTTLGVGMHYYFR